MRFTLGTDASTLAHPVQLCLASILMIMPSTYRKCIHSLSSKSVTSGYDSLRHHTRQERKARREKTGGGAQRRVVWPSPLVCVWFCFLVCVLSCVLSYCWSLCRKQQLSCRDEGKACEKTGRVVVRYKPSPHPKQHPKR
jgi:hypothetical protein